jgi:CBS domain-containing protein
MKIHTVLATKGSDVLTIHPNQSLKDAAALLTKHNIGALVVVNDSNAPVGILSERDIVRAAARRDDALNLPINAVMTRDVVTGSPQDDLEVVLQSMTDGHFRHMPILEQGTLVGIVSILDLVKAQSDQYQGKIDTLETIITGE